MRHRLMAVFFPIVRAPAALMLVLVLAACQADKEKGPPITDPDAARFDTATFNNSHFE